MPITTADILSLTAAKAQLRITTDDADHIVAAAIEGAVSFVSDATGANLDTIAQSATLKQAVIYATREFFNGFREIPPGHIVFTLMNVGACR